MWEDASATVINKSKRFSVFTPDKLDIKNCKVVVKEFDDKNQEDRSVIENKNMTTSVNKTTTKSKYNQTKSQNRSQSLDSDLCQPIWTVSI